MMLHNERQNSEEPLEQVNSLTEPFLRPEDVQGLLEGISRKSEITIEELEDLWSDSETADDATSLPSQKSTESFQQDSQKCLQSSEEMDIDLGQLDEIFSQDPTKMPYEMMKGFIDPHKETQAEPQKPASSIPRQSWRAESRKETFLRVNPPEEEPTAPKKAFITARKELQVQNLIKYGRETRSSAPRMRAVGLSKSQAPGNLSKEVKQKEIVEEPPEQFSNIDPNIVEMIKNEIMMRVPMVHWKDIMGLTYAKKIIQEAIVLPMLRPDIFTGLRRPPRGILLFGPPGTGKTQIGKCIASQTKATFFNISASALTSKYIGEGEKMVRGLFAVASAKQPSVIFIDEVDSLLCQRSENEHESSRRLKTEFLVHLDGAATNENELVLVVGATNRPQELDEAVRRRFVKRLYIPLPIQEARQEMVKSLLENVRHSLTERDVMEVSRLTEGFSGADMKTLCQEASMGPVRLIPIDRFQDFNSADVRPVMYEDFRTAMECVRASVSPKDVESYLEWDRMYGSGGKGQ
ncbi:fidgetin-like protein 1 [Phlebotomus argentipes]|uniref:fidgetin-like protein 1 n=1 Tax=Phlebotomus argentipes TaxID=94469 RepID=UPI002892F334|nr:fidgetin-like protein 1 [Phlebotomus argentipes]